MAMIIPEQHIQTIIQAVKDGIEFNVTGACFGDIGREDIEAYNGIIAEYLRTLQDLSAEAAQDAMTGASFYLEQPGVNAGVVVAL